MPHRHTRRIRQRCSKGCAFRWAAVLISYGYAATHLPALMR